MRARARHAGALGETARAAAACVVHARARVETSFRCATGLIHLSRVGKLSLFLQLGVVGDEQWSAMLGWGERWFQDCEGSLAYLPRGQITPRQRQAAAGQGGGLTKRICLVTDSAMLRGTLTAYSWLKPGSVKYGAFATHDVERALAWLAEEVRFDVAEGRVAMRRLQHVASAMPPEIAGD